jgi:hypothetical protein
MLKLDTYLEASDMGEHQAELAEYVMASSAWNEYVDKVNAADIPSDFDNPNLPSDDWSDSPEFHPNDLLKQACKDLGWHSQPSFGGLSMNFFQGAN